MSVSPEEAALRGGCTAHGMFEGTTCPSCEEEREHDPHRHVLVWMQRAREAEEALAAAVARAETLKRERDEAQQFCVDEAEKHDATQVVLRWARARAERAEQALRGLVDAATPVWNHVSLRDTPCPLAEQDELLEAIGRAREVLGVVEPAAEGET